MSNWFKNHHGSGLFAAVSTKGMADVTENRTAASLSRGRDIELADKKKLNFDRIPKKPIMTITADFKWEPRPLSQNDTFTGGTFPVVVKHDLVFTMDYEVECNEEQIDDGEFDYNSVLQIEHMAVLAPATMGGSLFFKSFGDGFKFDGENLVKDWSTQYRQLIATQELWGNATKQIDLQFTCRLQYFARVADLQKVANISSLPSPAPMFWRSMAKFTKPKTFMVGPPPAPPPIPPFAHSFGAPSNSPK